MKAALQNRCACGGPASAKGQCPKCRARALQRKAASPAVIEDFEPVHRVLRTPGRPLDPDTRAFMESRLGGHDFSRVQIHTGEAADESARAMRSHAFTVNTSIVFARGRFDPSGSEGRKLLAHELAHVAQQSSAPAATSGDFAVSTPGDYHERAADAAAERTVASGPIATPLRLASATGAVLQRQEAAQAPATIDVDAELDTDFRAIVAKLDESHYSDPDEGQVIALLRKWGRRRTSKGRNALDALFSQLVQKQTRVGVTSQVTNYYSLIFNYFDRVAEVRKIRDEQSTDFVGDEGVVEASITDELKDGQWKKNAEEYWGAKFKEMGKSLSDYGMPGFFQNSLGAIVGVLQGFAELAVEFAEGILSLASLIVDLNASVFYVLTGAAQEMGFGFLAKIPFVGKLFDPETYRGRYEATANTIGAVCEAFKNPRKVWEGAKEAAVKTWDEVMKEYDEADEFNKSRIIARGVVKVGMAIGGAIKDLPKLASTIKNVAGKAITAVIKFTRVLAEKIRSVFRIGMRIFKGTWRVIEDTLETGVKRLRYFFTKAGSEVAEEIPPLDASQFVTCTTCSITAKAKGVEKVADAMPSGKPKGPEVFEALREDLGRDAAGTAGRTTVGESAKAIQGEGLNVDLAVQTHSSAPEVRGALGTTGKAAQSAHIGPTSFLKDVPGYTRGGAFTTLLDPATHRAFDDSWKLWAQAQRRLGRTQCTIAELRQAMSAAIQGIPDSMMKPKAKGTLGWALELEFDQLGLKSHSLVDLPYSNIKP